MKRMKLKMRRISLGVGFCEMAEKIEISKQAYYKIENGISNAKLEVWKKIQSTLNLADEEMWSIIKGE
jgi:DNA-binding XRE family transcriptional regulator